jgi:isovaleryl-CoA dehydrogenase
MNFQLTEAQQILRDSVRAYARRELAPLAERIDRDDEMPREIWTQLGAMGLLGIGIDEEYGGSGGDMVDAMIAGEEIARASAAVALSMGAHGNLCAYNLFRNGSEAQKARYLPGLCSGEAIGCLGITEPGAGSDAVGMTTTAVRDGDHYVLKGGKTWVTNAPIADVFMVYAKTNPEAGPFGISTFLLERGYEGLSTSKPFEKMGCRGSPTGRIFLDGCRVPAENLVGQENGGIAVLMSGLDIERLIFSSLPIAQMDRALELSLAYARERKQFGRPIAKFQLIQAKLADMYTQLEAARALAWRAAAALDGAHTRGGKGTEIHKLSAAALLFAAEAAERVAYDAVQIHGGNGFSLEYEINRIYRDVRLGTLGAGTSEIRRLIIARELLGI